MKKISILCYLWIPFICFAQGTGKIMGVVSDKSSGEPLPGVNIILENTRMGASSDIDGYYVILNVPVSTFTLRANDALYSIGH